VRYPRTEAVEAASVGAVVNNFKENFSAFNYAAIEIIGGEFRRNTER
jgi:hypothetical protein